MTQIVKRLMIIASVILVVYVLFIPRPPYEFGRWGKIFNWEKHRYSFCTYVAPPSYEFVSYENDASDYLNEAAFLEDKEHSRYLILIKFQEMPTVNLATVKTDPVVPWRSCDTQYGQFHNIRLRYYLLWDFVPGLMSKEFDRLGDKLLLRGIQVETRRELTTPAAQAVYFIGQFERLGFYHQWNGWGGYPVPVLDFLQPRYGGVAVIRSRQSPETIFAILSTPEPAAFDAAEFRQIVESATFEKQTPDTKEWLQSFKKTKQRYRKETTQWGPFKWEREKLE